MGSGSALEACLQWCAYKSIFTLLLLNTVLLLCNCHFQLMPLTAARMEEWKRPSGRPRVTWMKTVLDDHKSYKLPLTEAVHVPQNQPNWRLLATNGTTQSCAASQKMMTIMMIMTITMNCHFQLVKMYSQQLHLTTACTICLNQIHPHLKWLYGPVVTRSICQGFILIWLRSLLFLDRCTVVFSFHVKVFVENACVCIRLIGPTYVVVLLIWLSAVFTVLYAVRLIIAFVDVNKTYLILSYLILWWYMYILLAVWLSGNVLASINVVALRQTRLVLGWVTVCGRVNHFSM